MTSPASAPASRPPRPTPPGAPWVPLAIFGFAATTLLLARGGTAPRYVLRSDLDLPVSAQWVRKCAACHGPDAGGVPGRGPAVTARSGELLAPAGLRADPGHGGAVRGLDDDALQGLLAHARALDS